jgi:hypothetical protein
MMIINSLMKKAVKPLLFDKAAERYLQVNGEKNRQAVRVIQLDTYWHGL